MSTQYGEHLVSPTMIGTTVASLFGCHGSMDRNPVVKGWWSTTTLLPQVGNGLATAVEFGLLSEDEVLRETKVPLNRVSKYLDDLQANEAIPSWAKKLLLLQKKMVARTAERQIAEAALFRAHNRKEKRKLSDLIRTLAAEIQGIERQKDAIKSSIEH